MSIQEDVLAARARGESRRSLAQASGLSEGKIWRIENKGNASRIEVELLQPYLDRVLGRTPPVDGYQSGTGDTETSAVPPVTPTVGSSWQPELLPLPDEPEPGPPPTTLVCGHTDVQHPADAACTRHPRNADYRLISNSELQTFKDCRRRWWLGWYRQLHLRAQSPVGARAVGNRLHRALQLWYVPPTQRAVDPRRTLERLIIEDWTIVANSHGGEEFVDVTLRRKFTDEANLERVMLQGYVDWCAETGADSEIEVIGSEAYVEADISDDVAQTRLGVNVERGVKIIGRLDVRVRRIQDGVRFFVDHKSVGNFQDAAALLPLDEQMLHYHLLEFLNSSDADERCDGALYNMLRKVKRSSQARPPFYQRLEVRHNPAALASYRRRMLATIRDVADVEEMLAAGADHRDVVYPRPTRDCRWKCDFFAVCGMLDDGSHAEAMIDQYFEMGDALSYYEPAIDQGGTNTR